MNPPPSDESNSMFEITTPAYEFEYPPDCNWLPSQFELLAATQNPRSEKIKSAISNPTQRPNLNWNKAPDQGPDWPLTA